jgi:hypothetical protein
MNGVWWRLDSLMVGGPMSTLEAIRSEKKRAMLVHGILLPVFRGYVSFWGPRCSVLDSRGKELRVAQCRFVNGCAKIHTLWSMRRKRGGVHDLLYITVWT